MHSLIPGASVAFTPPSQGNGAGGPVVHIYLLQILPRLTRLGSTGSVSELLLRYLVSVESGEPAESHRVLGELAFAAMESADFEVDLEPPAPDVWTALGVVPQPSLMLHVTLRRERAQADVPLVRVPLQIESATLMSLTGLVLGPEDLPLAGAHVELPGLRLRQTTDSGGRFHFPMVPRLEQQSLRVRAKGREMSVMVEPSRPGQPVIVRFESFEKEG